MMRIGLNFWFFDKFASSLSITNCVKNKSQKVTKEMKTPKINNSCPQKNYVTIGLKCLMPSFEENHKNHHKNIWYIFFNSRFIFRTQVMISKHFAKFFLLTFDPVLTKSFKMTFFFFFLKYVLDLKCLSFEKVVLLSFQTARAETSLVREISIRETTTTMGGNCQKPEKSLKEFWHFEKRSSHVVFVAFIDV